ncbi:MAG: hypothetical protein ACFFCS_13555, partial [Candidatus Hodarchaeota archaeon]
MSKSKEKVKKDDALNKKFEEEWRRARLAWSKYVRLQDPMFLTKLKDLQEKNMVAQIAAFNIADLEIFVNLLEVQDLKVEDLIDVILAHEVGHHVLAPGNLL